MFSLVDGKTAIVSGVLTAASITLPCALFWAGQTEAVLEAGGSAAAIADRLELCTVPIRLDPFSQSIRYWRQYWPWAAELGCTTCPAAPFGASLSTWSVSPPCFELPFSLTESRAARAPAEPFPQCWTGAPELSSQAQSAPAAGTPWHLKLHASPEHLPFNCNAVLVWWVCTY